VRTLIQKNREDEHRHLTWIRDAVRNRPWQKQGAPAAEGPEIPV
jgi:hypothetical protein